MKGKVSAFMDGELEERAAGEIVEELARDGEARDAWRTYHLISDAMRDTGLLSGGLVAAVAARLTREPTVLSPAPLARTSVERVRRTALAAAASVAAVALVSWLAFAPLPGGSPVPVAQAPKAEVAAAKPAPAPALVPLPSETEDYLLAHQSYSPRNSLQGVVPYVRTVSSTAGSKP